MSAAAYAFLLGLWITGDVTAEQLKAKVPKYITQDQYDIIISTPQKPIEPLKAMEEV